MVLKNQRMIFSMNYRFIYPGKGHGNPLQQSCLENPMDRRVPCVGNSPQGHRVGHDRSDLTHTHVLIQKIVTFILRINYRRENQKHSCMFVTGIYSHFQTPIDISSPESPIQLSMAIICLCQEKDIGVESTFKSTLFKNSDK